MATKTIYIGDRVTKEFHSVKRQKPQCNVKRITVKNRREFNTGKHAIADGYDACSHCTRYWKSKR